MTSRFTSRVPSGYNEASVSTYGKAGKLALGLGFLFSIDPMPQEAARTCGTDSSLVRDQHLRLRLLMV